MWNYPRGVSEKCGVSRQTINCIENDKYDPTISLAFKIAKSTKYKGRWGIYIWINSKEIT